MANSVELNDFYTYVQTTGKLRSEEHAKRWTRAVLQELGHNLPKGAKKTLASALPAPLDSAVTEVFHLAFFRNANLPIDEFAGSVGRRGGNSDPRFALFPIQAVFGGIQQFLSESEISAVNKGLSPELRTIWDKSTEMFHATL